MDIKRFQKRVEDFTCETCGLENKGDGFTNHCTSCLRSKHVDIFPGDRKESCGGVMDVTGIMQKKGRYVIQHTCRKCGLVNGDHVRPQDDMDAVIQYVTQQNERLSKR